MKRRIPESEDAACKEKKTSKREKECKNSEKSDGMDEADLSTPPAASLEMTMREGCGRDSMEDSSCHVELVETSAVLWNSTVQYFG